MRVLITGGAGFLGSHVVNRLLSASHDVSVLDNLSTGSSTNVPQEVPLFKVDVRAPLDEVFARIKPEVVVHLAAQVSVPASIDDPEYDLAINAVGTVNLLRVAGKAGVRKVIVISSAAVYGNPNDLPINEQSRVSPLSPYGLSKLVCEYYTRMLTQHMGLSHTIFRPSNIYGPRQTTKGDGAVVPSFLTRFFSGEDPVIHGTGLQTRDFIYVSDVASAVERALTHADGLTLNVSSGTGVSINELWNLLSHQVGWRRPPVFGPNRAGDILSSVMSNDMARKHLKWKPETPLPQGLAETVATWSTALRDVAASNDT